MNILLKSVKVLDKSSPSNGLIQDILIKDGIICQIAHQLIPPDKNTEIISSENLCVSAGWIDMRAYSGEPGFENRETLLSLEQAAIAGGFTEVVLMPNTLPVVQNKQSISFFQSFSEKRAVTLLPAAAVTLQTDGIDFTEIYDLNQAGSVAFTDGLYPIWNADILLKTLQYLAPVKGLLLNHPEEKRLAMFGQMHEGNVSTSLGLKGIPAIAETIALQRDLQILAYLDIKSTMPVLHFSLISTAESVELLRKAKAIGLPISCDIAAHQIAFTDSDLSNFDTNLKVNPPFRHQDDIAALWAGLVDGTIDAIVSDHQPHDQESKNIEFDLASFGIIGLETLFAVMNTNRAEHIPLEMLIEKITTQPRRLLKREPVSIVEGQEANLTIFDSEQEWIYENIRSKSRNTPFLGHFFKGKVVATIHKNHLNYA